MSLIYFLACNPEVRSVICRLTLSAFQGHDMPLELSGEPEMPRDQTPDKTLCPTTYDAGDHSIEG